ncbi:N-6 DNA methylase [Candidatus Poriferisodalis sp.]|uniref:N-6 DNA methylase n=1 Tax=Candidatus Poriferisodalis sp. TaxID=3101277 RepID=UPI003AF8B74B
MVQPTWSLDSALAEFSSVFRSASEALNPENSLDPVSQFALDGQAGAELRRLLPPEHRRRLGAFFTSHELAHQLAAPLIEARGDVVVVDPSCGAGDLLVAAAHTLGPSQATGQVNAQLIGIDVIKEFAEAARFRLGIQSRISGHNLPAKLIVADGRRVAKLGVATHVLLNPPFAAIAADQNWPWAQGNVSGAADFLAAVVSQIPHGCQLAAILPEVLRGGSRYGRWRDWIGKHIEIEATESLGRFDRWTDVDVFLFRGYRVDGRRKVRPHLWVPAYDGPTVGDQFEVTVGPVVHNRHPEDGPMRPFLTARGLSVWETIERVEGARQFRGKTHCGPFVVVPRTSRPDERGRAPGAIVADTRLIAVDNHLLVLKPRDHSAKTCKSLLQVLRHSSSDAWLDQTMRCRHLTVGAVASLPWVNTESLQVFDGINTSRSA